VLLPDEVRRAKTLDLNEWARYNEEKRARRERVAMQLSESEKEVLAEVVEALRADFGALEVVLYGSAARDDLEEGSDIDLFVVFGEVNWEVEKRMNDLCFEAGLKCGRVISTACLSRAELTESPLRVSPFVLNVRREGICL
jgi:predicted nucleotidyltransferase